MIPDLPKLVANHNRRLQSGLFAVSVGFSPVEVNFRTGTVWAYADFLEVIFFAEADDLVLVQADNIFRY